MKIVSGIIGFLKRFKATIAISAFLIIAFLFFSKGELFAPVSVIQSLAFNIQSTPQNIFFFWLGHAGYPHLLANVLGLLIFGLVVEARIGSKQAAGLFFFSGIGAPLLFTLFFPAIQLVGASAGISGLLVAGFLLEPKKAAIALLVLLVAISGLVLLVTGMANLEKVSLQAKEEQAKTDLNAAIQQQDMSRQEQLQRTLGQLQAKQQLMRESQQFQEGIPIENNVHGIGAVLGAVYLFTFVPEETRRSVRQTARQIRSFFQPKAD